MPDVTLESTNTFPQGGPYTTSAFPSMDVWIRNWASKAGVPRIVMGEPRSRSVEPSLIPGNFWAYMWLKVLSLLKLAQICLCSNSFGTYILLYNTCVFACDVFQYIRV